MFHFQKEKQIKHYLLTGSKLEVDSYQKAFEGTKRPWNYCNPGIRRVSEMPIGTALSIGFNLLICTSACSSMQAPLLHR